MNLEQLKSLAVSAIEDLKAKDIKVLDVTSLTDVTDSMIICCGTSNRHTRAIAENLVLKLKENGIRPIGVNGEDSGEWILVDVGDIIVHIMLAETREYYDLDALWEMTSERLERNAN
ncbi:MAG: ribosome silencing factor [Gammaproteobacteria bacterium]